MVGAVEPAAGKLWVEQEGAGQVVGDDDFVLRGTGGKGVLQEGDAAQVLAVELGGGYGVALVANAGKIGYAFGAEARICWVDVPPQG